MRGRFEIRLDPGPYSHLCCYGNSVPVTRLTSYSLGRVSHVTELECGAEQRLNEVRNITKIYHLIHCKIMAR